jgi:serine/threonine protein kinase
MNNNLPLEFSLVKKDPIYESTNSYMYLGTFNGAPSVLKFFPQEFPSETVVRCYQRDHNIGSLLYEAYPDYFCRPLKFVHETNQLYAIKSFGGESLEKTIKEGHLSTENFLKVAIDICQGLQYTHEQNIIHCDVKPHNILINNDKCMIIDFESSFLVSLKNSKVSNAQKGFSFSTHNLKELFCT